jgi:hypothetical protein
MECLTPGGSGAGLAARAGYPIIVLPFALVANLPTPRRVQRETRGVRSRVHGRSMQRTALDRTGLRLRARDPSAGATAVGTVTASLAG